LCDRTTIGTFPHKNTFCITANKRKNIIKKIRCFYLFCVAGALLF